MQTKILIATGLRAAFIMGTVSSGFYSGTSAANAPAQQSTIVPARVARPAVARTQYVAPKPVAFVAPKARSW